MTATLLPIPDDPRFPALIEGGLALFPDSPFPRSAWLALFEGELRNFYPAANADSLKLTARHYAPFYLRDGHDVP